MISPIPGYCTWENFGEWYTIRQIFLTNIYKYSGITDRLPADLPSLIASAVMVRQKFPPPKFSRVQYGMYFLYCTAKILKICKLHEIPYENLYK